MKGTATRVRVHFLGAVLRILDLISSNYEVEAYRERENMDYIRIATTTEQQQHGNTYWTQKYKSRRSAQSQWIVRPTTPWRQLSTSDHTNGRGRQSLASMIAPWLSDTDELRELPSAKKTKKSNAGKR
jgi:hypothetical protein